MHTRLNKAKIWTCGVETRTFLNLAQGCMSVVTGDSFLCRVRQFHVRATEGKHPSHKCAKCDVVHVGFDYQHIQQQTLSTHGSLAVMTTESRGRGNPIHKVCSLARFIKADTIAGRDGSERQGKPVCVHQGGQKQHYVM